VRLTGAAGIRVRATRVDHFAIADGSSKHGFVDLSVRLREGRSDDVKRDAIARIFAALKDFMSPAMATRSIALSAEMRDINADLSPKFGNIRDHLENEPDRGAGYGREQWRFPEHFTGGQIFDL